jgi:tetratricopeptide (TPR) repeat protein
MAYVRRKGNQLAIVHGERNPGTGKVEQRVLFTLYSKAEALQAIGRNSNGNRSACDFQLLLEPEYPGIRFDWDKIRQGIENNINHLPDLYQYRPARPIDQFRKDLAGFARQLILADPHELESSATLITTHRYELEFLNELIRWRLDNSDQKKNDWNQDNPFYWRFALRGREVSPEAEEKAAGYYFRGELHKAEAVFRMLVDSFKDYADGHNYLGLIALDRNRLPEAVDHFRNAMAAGRRLSPKRLAKKYYRQQHTTRPYIRSLRNLALTLNRAGNYIEALDACEKLEHECGDELAAAGYHAAIYLNTGRWEMSLASSEQLGHGINPEANFIGGLAAAELKKQERAVELLLSAALHKPRAARMLAGVHAGDPTDDHSAEDHNAGVRLLQNIHECFASHRSIGKRFYLKFMEQPLTLLLLNEMDTVEARWHKLHQGGRHEDFDRIHEMRSGHFIKAHAEQLAASPDKALLEEGFKQCHR